MYKILYNPLSKSGKNQKIINKVKELVSNLNEEYEVVNIVEIKDLRHYLDDIDLSVKIVVVGGDGTIHYLVNYMYGLDIKHEVYFYGAGTGNDFVRNVNAHNSLILINEYFNNLPVAYFDGVSRHFINGCGIGLDAYVCNSVNMGHGKGPIEYKINTLKGFLKYKKTDMKVYIDGVEEEHNGVWLISVMNGIYQGGGMMFAPDAVMNDEYLDICLIKEYSRPKVITLFPKIFKGKHTKYVIMKKCKEIRIVAKTKCFIQLDGEVISNINELTVKKTED